VIATAASATARANRAARPERDMIIGAVYGAAPGTVNALSRHRLRDGAAPRSRLRRQSGDAAVSGTGASRQ
jgi:hypothetical protein